MEESILSKFSKYENAIERQLYRTLHELGRRHATWPGAALTSPQVLDVEVRGCRKRRGDEIRDPQ